MKIRDELSPNTKLIIDELGTFNLIKPKEDAARLSSRTARTNHSIGLPWGGTGQPISSPRKTQIFPSSACPKCSAIRRNASRSPWSTGIRHIPTHITGSLSLIHDNFGPGDKLVPTQSSSPDVVAQASITYDRPQSSAGEYQRSSRLRWTWREAYTRARLRADIVDETSGEQPPRKENMNRPGNYVGSICRRSRLPRSEMKIAGRQR